MGSIDHSIGTYRIWNIHSNHGRIWQEDCNTVGALTGKEKQELRKAGFLYREIAIFNNAKTPDGKTFQSLNTTSQNWRDMLQSRRDWVQNMRRMKWSDDQIINEILAYYTRVSDRSPFDFLQMESSPHSVSKRPSDSELIRQRKNSRKIKSHFGSKVYGAKRHLVHPRPRRPIRRVPTQSRRF